MKIKDLIGIIPNDQKVKVVIDNGNPYYDQAYYGDFIKIPEIYGDYTIISIYSSATISKLQIPYRHDYLVLHVKPTTLKEENKNE